MENPIAAPTAPTVPAEPAPAADVVRKLVERNQARLDRGAARATAPKAASPATSPADATAGSGSASGGAGPSGTAPATGAPADGSSASGKSPTDGTGTKAADAQPGAEAPAAEGDSKLAKRLAAMATDEARLRRAKADLEEAQKRQTTEGGEDAAKWAAFKEARTKGDRLTALEVLFDEGEITGDLYHDLTARVLAKDKAGHAPTREEAAEIAQAAVEKDRKQREAAATEAAKTEGEKTKAGYTNTVKAAFDADMNAYPLIKAEGVNFDMSAEGLAAAARAGVLSVDIHTTVEAHWKATGQLLTPKEVLERVESKKRASIEATGYARKVEAPTEGGKQPTGTSGPGGNATTVSSSWASNQAGSEPAASPPRTSYADDIADIKRRHFGKKK